MTSLKNYCARRICAVITVLCLTMIGEAQETRFPDKIQEELVKLHKSASDTMKLCSPLFASSATNRTAKLETFIVPGGGLPKTFGIEGDVLVEVRAESLRVCVIKNLLVFRRYSPCFATKNAAEQQRIPTLDRAAAVERAKAYCQTFKMDVPSDFKLLSAEFDAPEPSRWELIWQRFSDQYPWDFDNGNGSTNYERIEVVFHEKDGLDTIMNTSCCPPPKSLEVKIPKEQAIAKAEKCVPLVQRTPFYRSSLMDGFVAKTVHSCELKVAAPNWLLDPKRAARLPQGPPEETRLCWVVWFDLVDAKEQERRLKGQLGPKESLIPPRIRIYIDAATGEVVGARF